MADPLVYQPLRGELSPRLTEREIEVLGLMAQGKTIRGTARALHISSHTVRNHTRSIYLRLRVNTRLAAVIKGVQAGYITMEQLS